MDLSALTLSIGLGLGAGSTAAPYPSSGLSGSRDTSSVVASAFAGVRSRHVGLEGGFLLLPTYHSDVTVPDYPAYRMANFGDLVDTPSSAATTQSITSRAGYLRLSAYGPELWRMVPYLFFGRAWVRTTNIEHAVYTGPDETADLQITFNQTTRYMGAGLEAVLPRHWSVRIEAGYIPDAVRSYWTNHRDVRVGTFSASWTW
jgi:hypothetical protein